MKFAKTSVAGTVEILAADDFVGLPCKIDETGVVPAGMPITAAGKKATAGTNAAGVLLYDVNCDENPNGTIVVQGVIDATKAGKHAGIESYPVATLKTAVPGLIFRTNIGVNA